MRRAGSVPKGAPPRCPGNETTPCAGVVRSVAEAYFLSPSFAINAV